MSLIYILRCEDGKYYIGKTNQNLASRFEQHKNGTGSEWTKRYKALEIIDAVIAKTDMDEDYHTKIYMKKHGVNNVRGGSYVTIELPDYKIKALNDEFISSEDKCFKCGQPGHMVKFCKYKTTNDDNAYINKSNNNDNSHSKLKVLLSVDNNKDFLDNKFYDDFSNLIPKVLNYLFETKLTNEDIQNGYRIYGDIFANKILLKLYIDKLNSILGLKDSYDSDSIIYLDRIDKLKIFLCELNAKYNRSNLDVYKNIFEIKSTLTTDSIKSENNNCNFIKFLNIIYCNWSIGGKIKNAHPDNYTKSKVKSYKLYLDKDIIIIKNKLESLLK